MKSEISWVYVVACILFLHNSHNIIFFLVNSKNAFVLLNYLQSSRCDL